MATKGSSRSRAKKGRGEGPFFAAMHDTNVALCLGAGFVWTRTEPSAAHDHHAQAGGIVLSRGAVPSKLLSSARGALNYGSVAIVEMQDGIGSDLVPIPGTPELLATSPIPLAEVRRVLFKTNEQLKDFEARAYSDIPSGIVPLETLPEAFADTGESAALFAAQEAPVGPYARKDLAYDKLGGALAGAVFAQGMAPNQRILDSVIRVVGAQAKEWTAAAFVAEVAKAIEGGEFQAEAAILATYAGEIAAGMLAADGFDAMKFLQTLESAGAGRQSAKGIARFVHHATEVVTSRREVAEDAYEDAPGKNVPRALLLFLLNPDAERMAAIPKRIRRLGPGVYALACAFVGCFSGIANLPVAWKAQDPETLLAIGIAVRSLLRDGSVRLEATKKWESTGDGEFRIAVAGRKLLSQKTQAPKEILAVSSALERLGLKKYFDPDSGNLVVEDGGVAMSVSLSGAPIYPPSPAVQLAVVLDAPLSRKDSLAETWRWLQEGTESPLVVKMRVDGKALRLQASAYCLIANAKDAALQDAVRALVAFHTKRPVPSQVAIRKAGSAAA